MIIGVPKEIMSDEYRVSLLPNYARELISNGHKVIIEHDAGLRTGFSDQQYLDVGCEVLSAPAELYKKAKLILKVKAPDSTECQYLTSEHILFSFLHLASNKKLAQDLLNSKCTAIAYESIRESGELPILKPMSEIAGQLAIQLGIHCLMSHTGGKGVLVGKVNNIPTAKILVLGAGIVGRNSILVADNMRADVIAMDVSDIVLDRIKRDFSGRIKTYISTPENIQKEICNADLIIGAAFITDDKSPILINNEHLCLMSKNTVLLDVAIDQGGCFATSHPTTHRDPSYLYEHVIHCCISNLPGCVPVTASHALCLASFPYVQILADQQLAALRKNEILLQGVNVYNGSLTNMTIGVALDMSFTKPDKVID